MAEGTMIELPGQERVHDWLEANKLKLNCHIKMEPFPNPSDPNTSCLKVTAEVDSDALQTVLLMKFCIALRKGEV